MPAKVSENIRPMLTAGDELSVNRAEPGPGPWTDGRGDAPHAGLVAAEQDRATTVERARAADPGGATDLTATTRTDERTVNLVAAQDPTANAAAARARRHSRPGRPWERDFPIPIRDVLAMVSQGAHAAAPRAAASPVAQRIGRTRSPRQ